MSATRASVGFRFSFVVSILTLQLVAPPPKDTLDFNLSNASDSCCFVIVLVPLSSMEAVRSAVELLPFSELISPNLSVILATTTLPLVCLGSNAISKLEFLALTEAVRLSILAGEGSKASPSAIFSLPL